MFLFSVFLGGILGAVIGFALDWRTLVEGSVGNDPGDLLLLKWSTIISGLVGAGYFLLQLLRVKPPQEGRSTTGKAPRPNPSLQRTRYARRWTPYR